MAPEHFEGQVCKASDVWSLAITLHNILTHDYPFQAEVQIAAYIDLVQNSQPDLFNPLGKQISSECKDLILKMLEKDPKKRISIDDILQHPWVKNNQA